MSIGFAPLYLVLLILLLLVMIVGIGFFVRRGRAAPVASDGGRGLLRFVAGLSTGAGVRVGLVTAVGIVAALTGSGATLDVPIEARVPELPDGIVNVTGPTATITAGSDHLALTIEGLSIGTRILLASGQLFGGITFVVIALLVGRLARSGVGSEAYRGIASRSIAASAVVLVIGTALSSLLSQLAAWRGGVEALSISGWTASGATADLLQSSDSIGLGALGWPEPSFALQFDFLPLLIGLALGALAVILQEGERLRVRAERAEADVEGLV
ncbi:hypothetical protein BH09ACT4_BH09ACT4_21740 [soil metagenome]